MRRASKQAWGQASLGREDFSVSTRHRRKTKIRTQSLSSAKEFCDAPTSWADGKDSGDTPRDEFLEVPITYLAKMSMYATKLLTKNIHSDYNFSSLVWIENSLIDLKQR